MQRKEPYEKNVRQAPGHQDSRAAAEPCERKVEQSTDILEKYRRGSRKHKDIYIFFEMRLLTMKDK